MHAGMTRKHLEIAKTYIIQYELDIYNVSPLIYRYFIWGNVVCVCSKYSNIRNVVFHLNNLANIFIQAIFLVLHSYIYSMIAKLGYSIIKESSMSIDLVQ